MKVKIVIVSSLNNTIVTVVRDGKVVWWATPGLDAGAKRGSSNAAEALGGFVGGRLLKEGVVQIEVVLKGMGVGRFSVIKGLRKENIKISKIEDRTPIPHNGCKLSKQRRI